MAGIAVGLSVAIRFDLEIFEYQEEPWSGTDRLFTLQQM
jgi:hypothetical protein